MTGIALGRSLLEQNGSLTFQGFSLQEENNDRRENRPLHTNAQVGEQLRLLPHAWGFQQWQKRMRKMTEKGSKRRKIRQGPASQGPSKVAEVLQVGWRKEKWSNPNCLRDYKLNCCLKLSFIWKPIPSLTEHYLSNCLHCIFSSLLCC